jgi:hypothetical protein
MRRHGSISESETRQSYHAAKQTPSSGSRSKSPPSRSIGCSTSGSATAAVRLAFSVGIRCRTTMPSARRPRNWVPTPSQPSSDSRRTPGCRLAKWSACASGCSAFLSVAAARPRSCCVPAGPARRFTRPLPARSAAPRKPPETKPLGTSAALATCCTRWSARSQRPISSARPAVTSWPQTFSDGIPMASCYTWQRGRNGRDFLSGVLRRRVVPIVLAP